MRRRSFFRARREKDESFILVPFDFFPSERGCPVFPDERKGFFMKISRRLSRKASVCVFFFMLILLASSAVSAYEAVVTTVQGKDRREKTYPLQKIGENAVRLLIPTGDLDPNADYVEILPEFAAAEKGDAGYWILPRGMYGEFRCDSGSASSLLMIPIFGMKTPQKTFVAVVNSPRFECRVTVRVEKGKYTMPLRYEIKESYFPPNEDLSVDYYFLEGGGANYSGMARLYRKMRLDRGEVRTIKDRIADGGSPWLDYLCDAIAIRMTHASKNYSETKNIDYTPETELPVRPTLPFDKAEKTLLQLKELGVDKAAICVAGWQTGGYDGRCPQSFPIEESLGGGERLKEYIENVRSLGFQVDGHSNYTDAFAVSSLFSPDIVCKKKDGSLAVNHYWCGGKAYNLCPRNAWETFFPSEMEKIGTLGFRGACYIDVFSATRPYCCADPRHPCTRAEAAEYQRKMLRKARQYSQGAASECGWDHVAGELDYINYVGRDIKSMVEKKLPAIADGVVPFWELVYHGIILSNPDKITQNKLDPFLSLKLVEFGGRPIYYSAGNLKAIQESYEAFKPLRHLQRELMEEHEILEKGVTRTVYADGSEIVCNYSDAVFSWKGREVKPMTWELYGGK